MNYAIIGSAFDGNKGAASMLEASIQTISKIDPGAHFYHLSMYPRQDEEQNPYNNVTVLKASAFYLGVVINSLALLYAILPFLRPLLKRNKEIAAIAKADVLLDQGGITFVDGRGKFLIYNVASILPALMMRTKVVKCSQAMGPFRGSMNRLASRVLLPRVEKIFARGEQTLEHLKTLNLNNVELAADYAFSLSYNKEDKNKIDTILHSLEFKQNKSRIYVLPSEVVRKKCTKLDIDYVAEIAKFIDEISIKYEVMLVPHSMRFSTEDTHNNDIPLVLEIEKVCTRDNLKIFDTQVTAAQMRYLLSTPDYIVASRFHAMVSALANNVPVFVVGWSHKYEEVMQMFKIDGFASDLKTLSADSLQQGLAMLLKSSATITKKINKALPAVKDSSLSQAEAIMRIATNSRR